MRKLGWYAVRVLVAAMILGSVLLLAANLYVQSSTVQQRIRQALAATLRMPVDIRKTTLTPWEGLRIDGLSAAPVPVPGVGASPDFLKADSFRVHFALWPLIHRRFVVTLLWLDKPQLAWAQNSEGRWRFPPGQDIGSRLKKSARPEGTPPSAATPPAAAASTPPTVASVPASPQPNSSTPPPPGRKAGGFTVALDRFRLRHGAFDFLSAKRHPIGRFEEINLDGQLTDGGRASGTLWFGKARLSRVGFVLTDFHSNFAFDRAAGISLSDGVARFAGGEVTANFRLRTDEPGSPFAAEFHVDHVDLGQLLQQAGNRLPFIDGSVRGQVVASGQSAGVESRRATGRFELVDARLKESPLFLALGDAMRIEDLSHMRFKTAQLDCQLSGGVLAINPLLLVSKDLKIVAQGQYLTDDDRLDLHARLTIDEAVSRQLPDFIAEQFKPGEESDASGSKFVDFDLTGPLNNPKSNLYNRLVGDPMKGFFSTILSPGKPKTPKDKPPKHRDATPSPSPSSSPSPADTPAQP